MAQDMESIPNFIRNNAPIFSEISLADKWNYFLSTDLGAMYQAIPWDALTERFSQNSGRGHNKVLGLRGEIALMFLKPHSGLSDEELIKRLNSDYCYQFFCNVAISAHAPLKDPKLPSKARVRLAALIPPKEFQAILALEWKGDLDHSNIGMQDATCYETSMRYPTDVKLLFECILYLERHMSMFCKGHGLRRPRNKFREQKKKTLAYMKKRRNSNKKTRKRVKSLLYLLNKMIGQFDALSAEAEKDTGGAAAVWPSGRFRERYPTIKKVYCQRQQWFDTGEAPKNLIVSIDKPYIRPIVRGKENKRVEFGAKVNILQVDGLNFVEFLGFEAFHEGNRLQNGIHLHRELFGRCSAMAADGIYATNKNRKYCSARGIRTNFVPKGRRTADKEKRKQEDLFRAILNRERATRLEGSFGTEKEAYGLRKIGARSESTEILWIYFGIHARNAMLVGKRRREKARKIVDPEQPRRAA